MRIVIAIVVVVCWFGSMLVDARAQTPASPTAVTIQDKPVLLGDVDYYKMVTDAETKWKEALPKLYRNIFDYTGAWGRLRQRKLDVVQEWYGRMAKAEALSKERRQLGEMYKWCDDVGLGNAPKFDDADTAFKFAELDIRVRLCEEKLPPKVEKTQAFQPYDNRPMPFPGKPIEDKKKR